MHNALHLAVFRALAQRRQITGTMQFGNLASGILHDVTALDDIGIAQAHFSTGNQALVALGRHFLEISTINVELARKRNYPLTHLRHVWMAGSTNFFHLPFRIIRQHHLERTQYGHGARCGIFQMFAHTEFQHADINHAFALGNTDTVAEIT